MAVTETHPRLKVGVISEGDALREYDNDEADTSPATVTEYIEAQSGANFAVHCEPQRPFPVHPVIFKLYLDGTLANSRLASDVHYAKPGSKLSTTLDSVSSRVGEGQRVLQRFCFLELSVDDSHEHPVDDKLMKELKSMGEIILKAYYIQDLQKILKASPSKTSQKNVSGAGFIPEKALKGRALSHQAGLVPRHTAKVTIDPNLGWAMNIPDRPSSKHVKDYIHVDPNKRALCHL